MRFEERDVPVKSIVLTINPDCKDSANTCLGIIKAIEEDEDTRGLRITICSAKMVDVGEEDELLIRKGNILVEVLYVDEVVSYTLMEPEVE